MLITVLALLAQFYVALYPIGGPNLNADAWFQSYLAGPLLIFLYLVWKGYSWFVRPADRALFIRTKDIDIYSGMSEVAREAMAGDKEAQQKRTPMQLVKEFFGGFI